MSSLLAKYTGSKNRLFFLLTLAFSSRLAVAIVVLSIHGPAGFWGGDTNSYLQPAASMLHGEFSRGGLPEIYRTPGYPLLLVPAISSHHLIVVALLENFLLATLGAWLVWRIVIDLLQSPGAATWAVLFYCFEPLGLLYSAKILSDVLFAVQFLLFLWLTIRFQRSPTYTNLAACALSLSLATYTRPITLFLALWLLPFFLFFPRHVSWVGRTTRAISFLLTVTLTLAPWIIRNIRVAGYAGFSTVGEYNLYFYSAGAVRARLEHKTLSQMQSELADETEQYLQHHPEQRASIAQIAKFQRAEAERTLSHHLLAYSVIHLRGCAVVLLDPAVTDTLEWMGRYPESGGLMSRSLDQGMLGALLWLIRHYPDAVVVLVLLGTQLLLYYLLGFLGLRWLPLETRILFVAIFAYFVLISGSGAVARYRLPVMPLLCVSAGVGFAQRERKSGRNMPPQAAATT